jgi:glycosyltransferase involved in cell wall biosynthesis
LNVAICHQGFAGGDAIGNDIVGMYRLLEQCGFYPTVICEWKSQIEAIRTISPEEMIINDFDLIVYHHSLFWQSGRQIVEAARCPIIFKYHNITPAVFFRPYSERYANICAAGARQTECLVQLKAKHIWLADSEYNKADLVQTGADPAHVFVVPPFNRSERLLRTTHIADYTAPKATWGCVGRLVPNKGHLHVLRIAAAFLTAFHRDFEVLIIGQHDAEFASYYREIQELIANLGIVDHVDFVMSPSDELIRDFYRSSHIYLCCSEHEGFCVPIVEAQAAGLPVIAAATTAVADTVGEEQFVLPLPQEERDYFVYAALINELLDEPSIRRHIVEAGYRNVRGRFSDESIENAFLGRIYDFIR